MARSPPVWSRLSPRPKVSVPTVALAFKSTGLFCPLSMTAAADELFGTPPLQLAALNQLLSATPVQV